MRRGIALLGVLVFAVFSFFYIRYKAPRIEADIAARTQAELSAAGLDFARVDVDGRDVSLAGFAKNEVLRDRAGEVAGGLWGQRVVANRIAFPEGSTALPPVAAAPPLAPPTASCVDRWAAVVARPVFFDSDSASFATARAVREIVAVAADCPKARLEVQGHTDSTGSEAYNRLLSQRRAEAFANLLASSGIDLDEISVVAFGESQPAADNSSAAGRARNRRIDFKVEVN